MYTIAKNKTEASHDSEPERNVASPVHEQMRQDGNFSGFPKYLNNTTSRVSNRNTLQCQALAEEEAMQMKQASSYIHAKLTISQPDDPYEQEADRVADQVMSMPDTTVQRQVLEEEEEEVQPKLVQHSLQRQADEDEEEEIPVQTKSNRYGARIAPSNVANHVKTLSGAGQPLPLTTKGFFESRFRESFDHVRIHNDSISAQTASTIQAKAYTTGPNIVFAQGQYSPGSQKGKRLLAHELTHVIQQTSPADRLQRVPSAAGEGAAMAGEANPNWAFQRNMEDHGLQMNPAFWQVTYVLTSNVGTRRITNSSSRSALDNLQRFLSSHRSWLAGRSVSRIEIRLLPGGRVSPAQAARDLMNPASARHYRFECFTASALIQFIGAFRGLQQTEPATAIATFNRDYADFEVVHANLGPVLTMGGSTILANLGHLGTFSLYELLHDASDRGLERGDWVVLDNEQLISHGAFRRENATYLGSKRFFGHGFGIEVFDINYYARRLRSRHSVTLPHEQILRRVRVEPFYRPPHRAAAAAVTP